MGWRSVWTARMSDLPAARLLGALLRHRAQAATNREDSERPAGEAFISVQTRMTAAFLGVPYAAPPIGELRSEACAAGAESGVEPARRDNFGSPCPQLPAPWFPYIEGDEDCLYLNIWTTGAFDPMRAAPVLVYFHGGNNTQGYSQMTPLGPPLSADGIGRSKRELQTRPIRIPCFIRH